MENRYGLKAYVGHQASLSDALYYVIGLVLHISFVFQSTYVNSYHIRRSSFHSYNWAFTICCNVKNGNFALLNSTATTGIPASSERKNQWKRGHHSVAETSTGIAK